LVFINLAELLPVPSDNSTILRGARVDVTVSLRKRHLNLLIEIATPVAAMMIAVLSRASSGIGA
jgi:hypothetical protein